LLVKTGKIGSSEPYKLCFVLVLADVLECWVLLLRVVKCDF
jgi:hypothetical protein